MEAARYLRAVSAQEPHVRPAAWSRTRQDLGSAVVVHVSGRDPHTTRESLRIGEESTAFGSIKAEDTHVGAASRARTRDYLGL